MSTAEAVASVLSAGDVGQTADEIADALGLPVDGAALQPDLEEMVERGILERCGIGRGALYTLVAPVPTTRDASGHMGDASGHMGDASGHMGMVGKGPATRVAG